VFSFTLSPIFFTSLYEKHISIQSSGLIAIACDLSSSAIVYRPFSQKETSKEIVHPSKTGQR
jgi:hypothetical protein